MTIKKGSGIKINFLFNNTDDDPTPQCISKTSDLNCLQWSFSSPDQRKFVIKNAFQDNDVESGKEIAFEIKNVKIGDKAEVSEIRIDITDPFYNENSYIDSTIDNFSLQPPEIKKLKINFAEKEEYDISNVYDLEVEYEVAPYTYHEGDSFVFEFSTDSENLNLREAWVGSIDNQDLANTQNKVLATVNGVEVFSTLPSRTSFSTIGEAEKFLFGFWV